MARLNLFFVLPLAVRGLPSLLLYRTELLGRERTDLTATALPLLVALAEIGLRNGVMLKENAAAGRRRRALGARPPGPRRRPGREEVERAEAEPAVEGDRP